MLVRRAIFSFAVLAAPIQTFGQSGSPVDSTDSSQVRETIAFLVTGNANAPEDIEFRKQFVGHWNADSVMVRLASKGVWFGDVNEKDSIWFANQAQIRAEIVARKGRSYNALAYLGFTSGIPYPQYSKLAIIREGSRLRVSVGDVHELTFEREGGKWRLASVRLVEEQGE